jgi:osmotically-inducible protein OsmY
LAHVRHKDEGVTGIALSAALGLGVGLVGGMLLRGLLSDVATEPVRDAVRNLRRSGRNAPSNPEEVEHAVSLALRDDPDTRDLAVRVDALGDGIVELTGTAPDPLSRQIAADIARAVPGADIVVNRILVEGSDGAPAVAPPTPEAS